MRFAVEKCSSVLRENYFALEKITGIPLLMVSQPFLCFRNVNSKVLV